MPSFLFGQDIERATLWYSNGLRKGFLVEWGIFVLGVLGKKHINDNKCLWMAKLMWRKMWRKEHACLKNIMSLLVGPCTEQRWQSKGSFKMYTDLEGAKGLTHTLFKTNFSCTVLLVPCKWLWTGSVIGFYKGCEQTFILSF